MGFPVEMITWRRGVWCRMLSLMMVLSLFLSWDARAVGEPMIEWHGMPCIFRGILLLLIQCADQIRKQWQSFSLAMMVSFLFFSSLFGHESRLGSNLKTQIKHYPDSSNSSISAE